jgi:SAM-dependent methyltransferase
MVVRSISAMDLPAPWTDIGEHGVLPRASHDEVARFNAIANVNAFLAGRLAPRVRTAYERRAKAAYRQREGREPENRGEVDEALRTDPAYRVWSTLRRNAMETRQQAGRQLVLRQARELRDRARALNAGAGTLQLDPQLRMPPYVAAVDTHLMPGGYTSEVVADDVTPAANYDAGLFVTIGGSGGPWNDGAGRALVAWLGEHHSGFQPRRIADLGCGLGHNTLPVREAFPGAEVIAIDVAAPMLRYGHARARALGISDVTFSQQDATQTNLPDASFDLVFTTMVLHETSHSALPKLLREAHRLLRPGGLTVHLEQPPYRGLEPFEQFMRDWDGRYNNEPFWTALHESSLPDILARCGFAPDQVFESSCSPPVRRRVPEPGSGPADSREDFGRAPRWYVAGAWRTAEGPAVSGEHG